MHAHVADAVRQRCSEDSLQRSSPERDAPLHNRRLHDGVQLETQSQPPQRQSKRQAARGPPTSRRLQLHQGVPPTGHRVKAVRGQGAGVFREWNSASGQSQIRARRDDNQHRTKLGRLAFTEDDITERPTTLMWGECIRRRRRR